MKQHQYATIAGIIFLIVAVVHLVRALTGWQIIIGSWTVPLWLSWVAFVVAGTLSYFGFKLSKKP